MTSSSVLDTSRIDMIRNLDTKGDSLLGRLVEVFEEEARKTMEAVRTGDGDGDATALHRLAHRLHGSAANLGAPMLASACADLEAVTAEASESEGDVGALVAQVESELARALGALHVEAGRSR